MGLQGSALSYLIFALTLRAFADAEDAPSASYLGGSWRRAEDFSSYHFLALHDQLVERGIENLQLLQAMVACQMTSLPMTRYSHLARTRSCQRRWQRVDACTIMPVGTVHGVTRNAERRTYLQIISRPSGPACRVWNCEPATTTGHGSYQTTSLPTIRYSYSVYTSSCWKMLAAPQRHVLPCHLPEAIRLHTQNDQSSKYMTHSTREIFSLCRGSCGLKDSLYTLLIPYSGPSNLAFDFTHHCTSFLLDCDRL